VLIELSLQDYNTPIQLLKRNHGQQFGIGLFLTLGRCLQAKQDQYSQKWQNLVPHTQFYNKLLN
jgi:hypothetical protein